MLERLCFRVLLGLICLGFAFAESPPQSDLESRRNALNSLLAEQWEYTLRTNPALCLDPRR